MSRTGALEAAVATIVNFVPGTELAVLIGELNLAGQKRLADAIMTHRQRRPFAVVVGGVPTPDPAMWLSGRVR